MNLEELGYYTIDNAYRHNDGAEQYYIVREIYQVTFSAPGTKEFCETIKVDGEELTTSCVKVTATYDAPVLSRCAEWTPDTFLESGVLQGLVMKGTTSLTSKIKNKDLTSRNASSLYSNWLGLLVPNIGSTYGSMQTTYAKPGDEINWANCYYPGAQALYNQSVITGNAHITHTQNYLSHSTSILGVNIPYRNDYKITSSTDSVNGMFKVGSSVIGMPNNVVPASNATFWGNGNGSNPWILNTEILRGDATARESSHDYDVRYRDDAGKTYKEIITSTGQPYYAQINYDYHLWFLQCGLLICPYWHTNSFLGRFNWTQYSYNAGTLTSQTQVIIPYNFTNSMNFTVTGTSDDVVFPGDTIHVGDTEVHLNERNNSVTSASYITQVDNAEVRLVAYVSDKPADQQPQEQTPTDYNAASTNLCDSGWLDKKQCMEVNKYNGGTTTLYNRGNDTSAVTYGDTTSSTFPLGFAGDYNVFDASAGDYMCFVMAAFPWRSGPEGNDAADKTTNSAGTESKWLITAPQCKRIAKKPSMEILGSSIYTNGGITSSVSRKHNLFAETIYTPGNGSLSGIGSLGNPAIFFGSFDEEAVVAGGLVNKFASGATLGRVTTNAAKYGSTTNDFCNRWVPLTFANYSKDSAYTICGQGFEMAGQSGIMDASIVDREALVDYFIPSNAEVHTEGTYTLGGDEGKDIPNGSGKSIRYLNIYGTATIATSNLSVFQTRVVRASENITINGDIKYIGSYSSAAEVPKAVIYSSKDIHISCNVSRIDAILIAGGTVYTCGDYTVADTGSMENAERSQAQLVINGAILATKVELGRTYGSAAGNKSGVAAEIVNYDTSALVWGRSAAGSGDSNAMSTVYLHELAPRY